MIKMRDENDKRFRELSEKVKDCIQRGNMPFLVTCYKEMSRILDGEKLYEDELRLLMCIFHIKLAGLHRVDVTPEIARESKRCVWLGKEVLKKTNDELLDMYMDAITPNITPAHIMTNRGSQRVFEMILEGNYNKANRILQSADNIKTPKFDG